MALKYSYFSTMKKLVPYLKNKFTLATLFFVIWMLFFDRNDLISQYSFRCKLHKVMDDKAYYLNEIEQNKKDMHELMSDKQHLEKFARERYLMKKDQEDIFLIIPEKKTEETSFVE